MTSQDDKLLPFIRAEKDNNTSLVNMNHVANILCTNSNHLMIYTTESMYSNTYLVSAHETRLACNKHVSDLIIKWKNFLRSECTCAKSLEATVAQRCPSAQPPLVNCGMINF